MNISNPHKKKVLHSKNAIKNYVSGIVIIILFLFGQSLLAQVGIGNTDPKATLDITIADPNNPTGTDGILVPRVNTLTFTGLNADQNGILVYLTADVTISTVLYTKGFYYWDNGSSSWNLVGGSNGNTLDEAYDQGGLGVGRTIEALDGAVTISGEDGLLITGTFGNGEDILISGTGTRMFFNPKKSAFRAGHTLNDYWDNINVGEYSFASGFRTTASGEGATAMGRNTVASGFFSFAIGNGATASNHYSTAMGTLTEASGAESIALGRSTIASGLRSTAMGLGSEASGDVSTAMGSNTVALGNASTALGSGSLASGTSSLATGNSTASGSSSTAMGIGTQASGSGATSMGFGTTASGDESTAMGRNTIASGPSSTAMGELTEASGYRSIAMGYGSDAISQYAVAIGNLTLASNPYATAMGSQTIASGFYTTAMGEQTTASGSRATAMGQFTEASGDFSTAMGSGTTASGNRSTAIGSNTTASGNNATAMGTNTTASSSYATAMGNNTIASGSYSTALGRETTSSGSISLALGYNTFAPSYAETSIGSFNNNYTPNGPASFNSNDQVFSIGNGTSTTLRSNALTVYKSGLININDAYNLPLSDGSTNQIMSTNGSGQVSFVDASTLFTDTNTTYDGTDFAISNQTLPGGQVVIGISATGTLIGATPSDSDNQNISGSVLTGTNLTIGIQNGTSEVVNLASLQDGTGTDDQNLTVATLTGTTLNLGIENGTGATVNLASLQDGTGTDNQNIQGSVLTGTNLTIGIENGASEIVNLASLQDGTGTDDQTIDNFSFNTTTNELTLEIENDGIAAQTVDLSSLNNTDIDWHEEGTTSAPNNINDNIFTHGNVGIGIATPDASLDVEYSGTNVQAVQIDYTSTSNSIGPAITDTPSGLKVNTTATSSNRLVSSGLFTISGTMTEAISSSGGLGIINSVSTIDANYGLGILVDGQSDRSIGIDNRVSSPSTINYGIKNNVTGGSDTNYGVMHTVTAGSNINYGVYSYTTGATTNWAGYFGGGGLGSGNVYIQDTLEVDGTLNYTDGNEAAGFILESDATGDASWVNPSTVFQDNQTIDTFSFNTSTNELTLEVEDDGIAPQTVDLSSLYNGNTLDQAYNQGGAGVGRIINATNGTVVITGTDGFSVSGTHGFGATISSGLETKMFFNPRKSAFRAGRVDLNQWNDANVGDYSVAFGEDNTASGAVASAFGRGNNAIGDLSFAAGFANSATGASSMAFGTSTTASGTFTTTMGYNTVARSYAEVVIGRFNKIYTPSSTTSWNSSDQVFAIGNGGSAIRGNALTIYKSGLMNINDEYDMPLTRGTANQVMSINGTGQVNFVDTSSVFTDTDDQTLSLSGTTLSIADGNSVNLSTFNTGGDITGVIAGIGLTGGGNIGDVTLNVIANNGLTANANDIQLGGTLIQDTNITYGAFDTRFNLNGTGDFIIQDNGISKLVVLDNGDTVLGGDLYWRDGNTSGTVIARMIDDGDDGHLQINENGTASILLDANGASIFNEQGFDRNFRIETNNSNDMFFVDGGTNRIGIGTTTPAYRLSVDGELNLREGSGTGVAMRVEGNEAIYYNATTQLFSWGFGGAMNYFADDVGIGTNVPSYKLDVRDNPAGDYVAQYYNTSTDPNADGLKIRVGRTTAPTSSNSFLGFFDGNNTSRGRVRGNGVGVQFLTTSDRRLKTNIEDIDNALNLINKIRPRLYEYKENLGTQEYGFIAQELQLIYSQAVSGSPDSDVTEDPMMVDYGRLTPLLAAGIKELKQEVDTLKKENTELKAKLNRLELLETRLTALENRSNPNSSEIASSHED